MKKLFTLLLTGLSVSAFAQKGTGTLTTHINTDFDLSTRAVDTVNLPTPVVTCIPNIAVGLLTLGTDQVSGANSFGDKEKAQFFSFPGGGNITGVLVFYGMKKPGAAAGTTNFTVKLYTSGASGPNAFLGTSSPVAYSAIDTTGNATYFNFAAPVAVASNFFASVVVDPGGGNTDTTAVLTLFDGTNPTNDCGDSTAWERQGDNSWHLMNGSLSSEWGVDVQFLVAPIISHTAGVDELSPVTAHKVYPNAATDFVNISYSLNRSADVKINIIDMNGKILQTLVQPNQNSGSYNHLLDISAYTSGIYTYQIETGSSMLAGKLVIQ